MQVILTADVPHLGDMGDVVDVADGYGRNYLIPQQLAVQATVGQRRRFHHLKRQIERKSATLREAAKEVRAKIDGTSVTLARRTGAGDKLYGSVTNRDIAEALTELGLAVERRRIVLEQHLKELGIYDVRVKLHSDVAATVRVWIVKM